MFTKKPDKEPTPFDLVRPVPGPGLSPQPLPNGTGAVKSPPSASPASRNASQTGQSRIGSDLTIIGNLVSTGEIFVDGEVQGDLHAANIFIGDNARITGGLVANEVVVRGVVQGSVRGKSVILESSGKIEGDIVHTKLAIETGAHFEGKSKHTSDPMAGVQRPDVPPSRQDESDT